MSPSKSKAQLVAIAASVLGLTVAACNGQGGVVAVKPPSDSGSAAGGYACANVLNPPGKFRLVYSPDGTKMDTTAVYVNQYLLPHHSADTVKTTDNHGKPLGIIFSGAASYCTTVFDSLVHRLPNAESVIVL